MTTPEATPKQGNPALIVFGAIGLFLAVIGSLAFYFLAPRGTRLGAIDLRAETPSLSADLKAGDKLNVRLDVVIGTEHGYTNSSSRSRSNEVHEQLEQSVLTLSLVREGDAESDAETSTECRAYDGKATTGSSDATEVKSSGLPLRCKLRALKAGKHTIGASVVWVPQDVRKAKLEIWREREGE